MTTSKLDRRKKYTRMVLKDSLMKLLNEKQISSITVKEICELSDINRSTFYSHYTDQYDLLDKVEDEIMEDMAGYLSQHNFKKEENDLQMIEKLLEYFASKQEVCKTLLNENIDTTFQKKVIDFAHHFFMKSWMAVDYLDEDVSEYLSTFVISGSIHVIKNWLNNGMDKSPKEMAEIINSLIKKGLLGMK
ncbi:TetR family transcriptional regulator C-terminal domain-containing protein [Radiobacillus kanasensis]|uniref:TetR/AcrR family transcriptional regulator n=1 Tax=Radiobacillus kanasensis TaxID=2844358 RepID=UPI001E5DD3F9|nr:TetR-like C-terminal domain-containing protein [Radiobacillus kanasensis]UFU00218.1 TetR family transcriptional regulator C-terminal domain-containing protein [Radiobacillus kanasensis]